MAVAAEDIPIVDVTEEEEGVDMEEVVDHRMVDMIVIGLDLESRLIVEEEAAVDMAVDVVVVVEEDMVVEEVRDEFIFLMSMLGWDETLV